MQFGAFGFVSKISGKFFQEIMPVAIASVIGTLLVNHYSHRSASPPIVVQPPPPPPDPMLQTLHDEHELTVDYLKRDAEALRVANAGQDNAPAATPPTSAVKVRPQKVRTAAAEKTAPRLPSRPASETKMAAQDVLPPELEPSSSWPQVRFLGGDLVAEGSGAVRDWAVSATLFPVRAFSARAFGDPLTPPRRIPVSGPGLASPP